MTTFKEIRGQLIRKVSTDPTNPLEGQMWYNNTNGLLKGVKSLEAWSSASNNIVATNGSAGAGTQSSGLTFGGTTPGPAPTATSEYNGLGWAAGGTLNTGRRSLSGSGTQTAGLGFGGYTLPSAGVSNATEEYNGTAWTSSNNLNTSRSDLAGFGIQTASVAFGGHSNVPGSTQTNATEEYDGSTWTSVNNYLDSRATGQSGTGILTAGFGANAGGPASLSANTAHYDGTNWTASVDLPATRRAMTAAGTPTSTMIAGGRSPGIVATCFKFNGTAWSAIPSLGTARANSTMSSQMPSTATWFSQGEPPPGTNTSAVEEYNQSTTIITAGAWASGGNLGTARNRIGGAGIQTAALAFGGSVSPGGGEPTVANLSESYNGSSWSEGNNLGTARYGVQGCGTQTAALAVGGVINPNSGAGATRDTEEYNGTSWTAQPDTANNYYLDGVAGIQTAAVTRAGAGGPPGPANNYTEEYNGSSWTTNPGTIGTARYAGSFIGTQTAAIYCGGEPEGPKSVLSDTYDGSSFSSAPAMVFTFRRGGGAGTQTDALVYMPAPSSAPTISQQYNGTSWVTSAAIATPRNSISASGTSTAALGAGGGGSPNVQNATEEFTGETTAVNVVKITTS